MDMNSDLPQRKRPVHTPPIERHNTSVILFVTIGTMPRVPAFANGAFHDAFVLACGDADAWLVGKYMIMPDHIHMFCAPASFPRIGIKRWSGYLKERITKRLNRLHLESEAVPSREPGTGMDGASAGRNGPVCSTHAHALARGSAQLRPPDAETKPSGRTWKWQSDCWDTQIRSGAHYHEKWEYVRLNPVRKELVETPEDWLWQGELNVLRW